MKKILLILLSLALLTATACSNGENGTSNSANDAELPAVLADNSWSVNEEDFIDAVIFGETDAVRYMLEQGISPDTLDDIGGPAMYMAITFDQADIITLLIEHGADITYESEYGGNYLWFATINRQADATMAALLAGGVDLYYTYNGSNSLDQVEGQFNAYGDDEEGNWQRVAAFLRGQGLTPMR